MLACSHEPQDVLPWADKIIVLKDGQIIQQGNPQTIYTDPVNEYVAALFGSYNLVNESHLAIFSNIERIEKNVQNVILRPEHFSIVSSTENAAKGVVKKIDFWGNHFKVNIVFEHLNLIVNTYQINFSPGDEVFVKYILGKKD